MSEHRHISSDGAVRINQVGGVEVTATRLALVTIGTFIATMGASTHDITVGKPLVGLLIIELLAGLFDKLAIVVKFLEKLAGGDPMRGASRAAIHIERNP